MSIHKVCEHCTKEFTVTKCRESARFCSRACSDQHPRTKPNQACSLCGAEFYMKPSQLLRYKRTLGVFCSHACMARAKRVSYAGDKNPNYKGKNCDSDGYRIHVPAASHAHGAKRMKLHHAVCREALGIEHVPKGIHVHHRDCDILNNEPENLAALSVSDHKWLHHQFGVAALWAYCRGLVSIDDLLEWSDDRERAARLLPLNVTMQRGQFGGAP